MCYNTGNRLMAASMTLLSACWATFFWTNFAELEINELNQETLKFDTYGCASSAGMDHSKCQMNAAGGSLSVLAALLALGGGFYSSFQKNQAHMAAAFSLLNMATCVRMFVIINDNEDFDKIKDGDMELDDLGDKLYIVVGVLHLIGFLFGLMYFVLLRCELACCFLCELASCFESCLSQKENNFAYVAAMLFYLAAQAVLQYAYLDHFSCSTDPEELKDSMKDEIEKQMEASDDQPTLENGCVSFAFSGTFLLLGALACLVALILAFCQEAYRQGRVQQFSLAFSVAMACLAQASWFWWGYSIHDCTDEGSSVCTATALGGVFGLLGFPLATFTAVAFGCGCMSDEQESVVVAGGTRGVVVV